MTESKHKVLELGRPIKGSSARKGITIHMELGKIDIIDEFVHKQRDGGNRGYSRSEFVDEAITKYMKELGLTDK